jgi:hypothetical protein
MLNSFLKLSLALSLFTGVAHAERLLIDPNKADTLKCDDYSFKNEPYTLEGPQQELVFMASDGQTHSIKLKNHEQCLTKVQYVKSARGDSAHPWVEVDTSSLVFAMVDHREKNQGSREISSEASH